MDLLDNQPDAINFIDSNLMSGLHWACKRNYITMADTLIKRGADKNAQDYFGRTPLHMACMGNFIELTKLLLRFQVDLSKVTRKGLQASDLTQNGQLVTMINKAKKLQIIANLSMKPSQKLISMNKREFRHSIEVLNEKDFCDD